MAQPDAGLIAKRQAAGSGVACRLDHRAPAPLRNHARDNILAMRKKERQMRGRNVLESLKPSQPEFKLKQFQDVKSRLFDLSQAASNKPAVYERRPAYEKSTSPQEQSTTDEESIYGNAKAEDKGDEIDIATFEKECARLMQLHGKKPAPQAFKKDSAGCPAYLQKIKANMAEQQRQAKLQGDAAGIPPGYRQLPEEERKETLEALQKKREELEKAFRNLPLKIETETQKRRQKAVLEKIQESDQAIQTFSQPKVLIEA
jgi:hypothetical protein